MKRTIFTIMLSLVLTPGLAVAVLIEADLEIDSFTVLSAPAQAQVGEEFQIILQKVITNNGVNGPVDAVLSLDATAPLGSSVSPTELTEAVEDLAVLEFRTVQEVFDIIIGGIGSQTFTFVNSISLDDSFLDAGWADPDPNNNSSTLNVSIVGIQSVPEPSVLVLFGLGLAGLGFTRRRMKV